MNSFARFLSRPAQAFGALTARPAALIASRPWARLLALLILCAALFLPGIAALPVTDRDEARFAQATKQMLESGDFIDIRVQDEPRWKKPVGIYWMQAASVAAAGGPEGTGIWAWRVPSVIGATLAVLAAFWALGPLLGARAAFLASGLTATSLILAAEANIAKTDAMLLGLTVVVMGAWIRLLTRAGLTASPPAIEIEASRRAEIPDPDAPGAPVGEPPRPADPAHPHALHAHVRTPSRAEALPVPDGLALRLILWGALGLAVLVKGPIAPLVLATSVAAVCVAERSWTPLRAMGWRSLGPILFLVVVLPWLAAIHIASDGGFWAEALGRDLFGKIAGGQEKHGAPPGTYLAVVWVILWPWAPLMILAAPMAWRRRGARASALLLGWAIPLWLIIEATPTKLPHYLMPAAPALAGLVALWLTSPPTRPRRWQWILAAVLFALPGLGLPIADVALPAILQGAFSPWGALLALIALGFALLAMTSLWRERRAEAVASMIAAALALYPATLQFALPAMTYGFPSELMAKASAPYAACAGHPADSQSYREPSLVFLQGTNTRLMQPEEAAESLRVDPEPLVWIEDRRRDRLQAALVAGADTPPALRELTSVTAFNPNRGGETTLRLMTRADAPKLAACQP